MTSVKQILLVASGLVAGIFIANSPLFHGSSSSKQVRLGEGQFTNPLLECDIAEGTIDAEKINFKSDMENYVARIKSELRIGDIGIYFRDLNNGPTFGIHQNDPFVPASLLKVPVMMAYYRQAEEDPSVLDRRIRFSESKIPVGQQTILPEKLLVRGQEYSINELIDRMIKYSDNESLILLFNELPVADHRHLYSLLGVDPAIVTDPRASLSVKQYSSFFRILFNASFLSQEYSEKALELLSSIDYNNGLRAGTPKEVPVAHKFGERQVNMGERHLHDCGIVYYPQHPYLLCVMTRGAEVPVLERAIENIAAYTYEKVDIQYR